MKKTLLALLLAISCTGTYAAQDMFNKNGSPPDEYGDVKITSGSLPRGGLGPVTFSHWVHRAKFTCRLCHSDIGFAMNRGGTRVKASDNIRGEYCGACHNGKTRVGGKPVFASCAREFTKEDAERCERCHFSGKNFERKKGFTLFAAKMPKNRSGNGIDWVKAESDGLITLVDTIDNVPVKKASLPIQKELKLDGSIAGIPEIIFSHKKHIVWNGCEICHPQIFTGVKKGNTTYSMIEISAGMYCGVCHDKVAFPNSDCQGCHTKPVSF